jgi:hypothetical protein
VPATGELAYFSEMTVRVDLKDAAGTNPFLRNKKSDEEWVKRLVYNPGAASTYTLNGSSREGYPGGMCDPSNKYDYVIITTTTNSLHDWQTSPTTPYNWQSLMDYHTQNHGLSCTLVTIQDIDIHPDYQNPDPLFDDLEAHIREFCKDAYLDWETDYILIGGDGENTFIPAREMDSSAEDNVDADIYWNHLDKTFNDDQDDYWGEEGDSGFDLYAELFIGRITADVPKDVSNWMKKCFYYMDSEDRLYLDNAAFYGGDTGWNCQGDDFVDYSAIKGTDNWLGPNPGANTYPSWLGFQYGFETWNTENPGVEYDMTVKWTAEPPNPGGWMGGNNSAAINGLRNSINNNECALISAIAHANSNMSMDVKASDWENLYHNTEPFLVHDYGCHCGDMDAADDGVLHSMLLHSDTELAFACVYNTGFGWGNYNNTCSSSALQQKSFWDYLFDVTQNSGHTDNWQMGKAQAYSKDLMAPTINTGGSWRSIIQCCLLFGDPAMRIKPPGLPALVLSFPEGLPGDVQPPGLAHDLTIQIKAGKENYVAGSGTLYYRFDSGSAYQTAPVTPLGGDLFEATLPNTVPGDEPEFYFSVKGDGGTTIYSPWNAPAQVYAFDVYFVEELFHDDFEQDLGWTVQNINLQDGPWERGKPAGDGTRGDPLKDGDGSGKCYLTDNVAGNSDVDGGPTILTSPVIDLSDGDAQISYYRWHYNDDHDDYFTVEVSNDGGTTWKVAEKTIGSGGWNFHAFNISDFITPSAQVQVRFQAIDQPNNSVTEAGLDAFMVLRLIHDASLWADAYSIPVSTGGKVNYSLDAGPANASQAYMLMGSLSGTSPGFPLPGGKIMPLNWDAFTTLIVNNSGTPAFQKFMGPLDAMGTASATFDTLGPLDPIFIGLEASFAFLLWTPPVWDFTSNAIGVVFDP